MPIRQLIYRSQKAESFPESELLALLQECKEPNAAHEITGVLFYIDGYFIQCIEGSEADVEQLLSNIIRDARNINVVVLSDRMLAERAFPTWWMGFRSMSTAELMQQKGFIEISSTETLDKILDRHQEMLKLMRDYYHAL